jgi:hypothetical protein
MKKTYLQGKALAAIIIAIALTGISSCEKMPNDGVPIYLVVDSATVAYDGTAFGSTSARIPDVWATAGAHNLGGYQTPVKIPILAQGDVPMVLSAGIFDHGLENYRIQYPFYRPDTFTIANAIPGHVYYHHPVYHYFSNTQVAFTEEFESTTNGGFDKLVSYSSSGPYDSLFEGRCGKLVMAATDSTDTIRRINPVAIVTNGRQAYIEMNYKSDVSFEVGIRAINSSTGAYEDNTYSYIFFAKQSWTKSYLDVSNIIGYYQGLTPSYNFQLYFITYKLPGSPGSFYVDNIKLLYFN